MILPLFYYYQILLCIKFWARCHSILLVATTTTIVPLITLHPPYSDDDNNHGISHLYRLPPSRFISWFIFVGWWKWQRDNGNFVSPRKQWGFWLLMMNRKVILDDCLLWTWRVAMERLNFIGIMCISRKGSTRHSSRWNKISLRFIIYCVGGRRGELPSGHESHEEWNELQGICARAALCGLWAKHINTGSDCIIAYSVARSTTRHH